MAAYMTSMLSKSLQYMHKVSTSGISSCMCHSCSLNGAGSAVFIDFIDSCVCQAIVVLL